MLYDNVWLNLTIIETLEAIERDSKLDFYAGLQKSLLYTLCNHGIQVIPYMPFRDIKSLIIRPAHVPQLGGLTDSNLVYHVSVHETDKAVLYKLHV